MATASQEGTTATAVVEVAIEAGADGAAVVVEGEEAEASKIEGIGIWIAEMKS